MIEILRFLSSLQPKPSILGNLPGSQRRCINRRRVVLNRIPAQTVSASRPFHDFPLIPRFSFRF